MLVLRQSDYVHSQRARLPIAHVHTHVKHTMETISVNTNVHYKIKGGMYMLYTILISSQVV